MNSLVLTHVDARNPSCRRRHRPAHASPTEGFRVSRELGRLEDAKLAVDAGHMQQVFLLSSRDWGSSVSSQNAKLDPKGPAMTQRARWLPHSWEHRSFGLALN